MIEQWYQEVVQFTAGAAFGYFIWRIWPRARVDLVAVLLAMAFLLATATNLIATSIYTGEPRTEWSGIATLRISFIIGACAMVAILRRVRPA